MNKGIGINEEWIDICERLGWSVMDDDSGYIELEKYSPRRGGLHHHR